MSCIEYTVYFGSDGPDKNLGLIYDSETTPPEKVTFNWKFYEV